MNFCTMCGQEHDTTGCLPRVINAANFTTPPQGWECPKCHAVMAPLQPSCIHCTSISPTLSASGTG